MPTTVAQEDGADQVTHPSRASVLDSAGRLARGEVYYNYATTKAVSDELAGFSVFCKDAAGAVFHT